ncbi:MAG: DUF6456 domain-containing protein [Bdellovibrionales bacterium]|jgi:hypothetical protein
MSNRSPRRRAAVTNKKLRKLCYGADHGTPERWQHSGCTFEITDRAGVLAARATEENILDVLGLKLLLTALQIEAGLKFKADYQAAAIAARVTGSYTGMSNARDFFRVEHERSEKEEAAYTRWRAAVNEMGLNIGAAVISTVCYDAPPKPRDVPLLQAGLEKLTAWYKMGKNSLQNTNAKQHADSI